MFCRIRAKTRESSRKRSIKTAIFLEISGILRIGIDKSEFVEDNMKVDVIKKYFQSWLDNDVEIVKQTFSENALYSECYGPEYHGLSQIVTWFENWNNKGQVLEWTIKRIFEQNQTLIVEWFFRCNYDGKIDGFDGVTIADFDKDMKILKLCEFQSKAEHYYPYES